MKESIKKTFLRHYPTIERVFATLGFVGVGVGLTQTNASAGGASLLFTFLGYILLIIFLPLLAFMNEKNPLNRAFIKGALFASMAIICFAGLTIGVLSFLIAACFFAVTAVMYFFEPHIGKASLEHAPIGADAEKQPVYSRSAWKLNPLTRSACFH